MLIYFENVHQEIKNTKQRKEGLLGEDQKGEGELGGARHPSQCGFPSRL